MSLAAQTAGKKAARGREAVHSLAPQSAALLAWYDRHRRALPWRAPPGERADAYRVWLSEIMLQQTTVKAVAPYYARFLALWPDVRALAAAPLEEVLKAWAGLGYYARARNLHACARAVVKRHGAKFPENEAQLRALPGIGAYTAAAINAIAFDAPATPVDGNIERVVARLHAVESVLPAAKPEIFRLARALTPARRAGDFAQALMDLGATICTPKNPACALCPWNGGCAARQTGAAETFPRRAPKREGNLRRGAAFVARRADGFVLVRTRPSKGLLGGMTEVPTGAWSSDFNESAALESAPHLGSSISWRRLPGVVRHVFTHFPLELVVCAAEVPAHTPAPPGARWLALADIAGEALPSLMRKVVAHALGDVFRPRPSPRAAARAVRRSV
jgi:A/G-specific adenine glycosylase